jgi:tetratricopeptide (TPR) repeat protein
MIEADPDNPKWRLEGVYAASNLGIVEMEQRRYSDAAATLGASVGATELLAASDPGNSEYRELLLQALAYHADALDRAGRLDAAIEQRERQLAVLAPHLAQDRPDASLRQIAMIAHRALSRMKFERGDTRAALAHGAKAVDLGRRLIELEPSNADWLGRSAATELDFALLLIRAGRDAEAIPAIDKGCSGTGQLLARDPAVAAWREGSRNCLYVRAERALVVRSGDEALFLARQLLDAVRTDQEARSKDPFAVAQAHKLIGDILWRTGDRHGAAGAWELGLAAWPKGVTETPRQMAERGAMLRGTGDRSEGSKIAAQLAAMGYRQSLANRVKV